MGKLLVFNIKQKTMKAATKYKGLNIDTEETFTKNLCSLEAVFRRKVGKYDQMERLLI